MLLRQRICLVTVFSVLCYVAKAQPDIRKGWHLLDKETDGIQGISLGKAYQLLKNRPARKVVVAVIDGGIDTTHPDLRPVLWVNTREIAGNGIDDDLNGYTDDVHGWNFLGNANGENVERESSEAARVYQYLRPEFEGKPVDTAMLSAEEKEKLHLWIEVNNALKVSEEDRLLLRIISATQKALTNYDSVLRVSMGKHVYTLQQLEEFKPTETEARRSKTSMLRVLTTLEAEKDQTNKDLLAELAAFVEQKEEMLKLRDKPVPNYRRMITGDDEHNWHSRNYGNSDIMGLDAIHGTHVSGIIAAARNNQFGVDGIADKVSIMAIRAVPRGDEHDKDIALAIRYAVDNGASIINMSFGKSISPEKQWVDEAIRYAAEHNVLIVHAAGNEAVNLNKKAQYPSPVLNDGSLAPNVITVGASSDPQISNDLVATFTNYGDEVVDVLAPGVKIYSTISSANQFGFEDGTSMAAPVVSGVAALLLSRFPQLTAPELKAIIESSAVRDYSTTPCALPGGGKKSKVRINDLCKTGGIVNAAAAVELALQCHGN